jgi:hypothetical protein
MIDRLARPYVLTVAALLLGGVLLTGLNLLLIGWSAYAIGHIGAIFAFILIAWSYRSRMDGWAWVGLAVLIVGLVSALPQAFVIWSAYLTRMTGGDMLIPAAQPPFGVVAEYVTWIGLAFYALAARGARALPTGVAWMFVAASVVGILAALNVISPLAWIGAVLLVALGLAWIGSGLNDADSTEDELTVATDRASASA